MVKRVWALAALTFACGDPRESVILLGPSVSNPADAGARPDAGPAAPDGGGGGVASCVPAASRTYRIVRRRNIAAPLGDTTGVAYDGTRLWILGGGHNSQRHVLVEFDPNTYQTHRQFEFQGLLESLGTGAYGIAWDGQSIWISVSGNTRKLVRVDPTNGNILRSFSSPANLGPSDLEFDGQFLWLSSGTGDIYRIDPVSGGIDRSFKVTFDTQRDNGIAVRPGELWVSGLFGGLDIQDPNTGAKLSSVRTGTATDPTGGRFGALTFVDCQLLSSTLTGLTFYDVVPIQ